MTGDRWKRQERAVAALFGGVRLPNNGKPQPDVIAGNLAVQVKTRTTIPGWLWSAIEQADTDAAEDQIPVVVLCEVTGNRKTRRLVVIDADCVLSRRGS